MLLIMAKLPALKTKGERLKYARDLVKDRGQALLAASCNVSVQAVSGWERTSKVAAKNLMTASTVYGVPVEWLLQGGTGYSTIEEASSRRLVPVVSIVQAGRWHPTVDPFSISSWDEYLQPDVDVSENSFALRIAGTSMEPRFQTGDRVIIDPRIIEPVPGDFIVAKLEDDDEATFKRYRPRGRATNGEPIIDLVPENADWPTLTMSPEKPGRIVGTMVEHRKYRR